MKAIVCGLEIAGWALLAFALCAESGKEVAFWQFAWGSAVCWMTSAQLSLARKEKRECPASPA